MATKATKTTTKTSAQPAMNIPAKTHPQPNEKTHKRLTRLEASLILAAMIAMFLISLWTVWQLNPLLAIGFFLPTAYLIVIYYEKMCENCPQNKCPIKWLK